MEKTYKQWFKTVARNNIQSSHCLLGVCLPFRQFTFEVHCIANDVYRFEGFIERKDRKQT